MPDNGDDIIVVVGRNVAGEATYRAYTADDVTAPRGENGLDVSGVVSLSDLLNHSTDDGSGDQRLDGGAGSDTLVVYGRTDLSLIDLTNIERIIVNSDVTLTADQISGVTVIAGDGAIVRISGSGTIELPSGLTTAGHIEIGQDVVVTVSSRSEVSLFQIISGAGEIRVMTDDNNAFEDIMLAEGLTIAVNAGDSANTRSQTVGDASTVDAGDSEGFGGTPVPVAAVLPSGGLLFSGDNESVTGTSNADQFSLGSNATATGGGGDDLFVLPTSGTATITDFESGDRLRLDGITVAQIDSAVVASGTLMITFIEIPAPQRVLSPSAAWVMVLYASLMQRVCRQLICF